MAGVQSIRKVFENGRAKDTQNWPNPKKSNTDTATATTATTHTAVDKRRNPTTLTTPNITNSTNGTNGTTNPITNADINNLLQSKDLPEDYPITAETLARVSHTINPKDEKGKSRTSSAFGSTLTYSPRSREKTLKAPPRASSKSLSRQSDTVLANRAILTIEEDRTVCFVDEEQDAMIAVQFQRMNVGTGDISLVKPKDAHHLSAAIQILQAEHEVVDLNDADQSKRMILLLCGQLDDELESMVYTISSSTQTFQQRTDRFFEDGFSDKDIQKMQACINKVDESGTQSRDAASGTGSPKLGDDNDAGASKNNGGGGGGGFGGFSFGDALDFSALSSKLNALAASQSDDGAVEPTCADEESKEDRRQSYEMFYKDGLGNDALHPEHFDVTVVHKELDSDDADIRIDLSISRENSYRPRTSSRAIEPLLDTDDSYRPRTTSRAPLPDPDTL